MTERKGPPRTKGVGRKPEDVKADDPPHSLDRLGQLVRKVLRVPKDRLPEDEDR